MILRATSSILMLACVVISPSSMTKPVFVAASQATREYGSCSKQASNMPSLIWSHSLSGCPSVHDSEVNSRLGEFMKVLLIKVSLKELAPSGQERARDKRSFELPSHLPDDSSA